MLQTLSLTNSQIISTLTAVRQEWQQAAAGASLLEMEDNVGLMLADLVNSLGLSTQDQSLVLDPDLYQEIQEILSTAPQC